MSGLFFLPLLCPLPLTYRGIPSYSLCSRRLTVIQRFHWPAFYTPELAASAATRDEQSRNLSQWRLRVSQRIAGSALEALYSPVHRQTRSSLDLKSTAGWLHCFCLASCYKSQPFRLHCAIYHRLPWRREVPTRPGKTMTLRHPIDLGRYRMIFSSPLLQVRLKSPLSNRIAFHLIAVSSMWLFLAQVCHASSSHAGRATSLTVLLRWRRQKLPDW